jgi:uncharacterized coiled-coil DUF342 family protein
VNKQRRRRIEELRDKLSEIKDEIESLRDEEQEYFDNMPEAIAEGQKGQQAEASVEVIEDAVSSLDEAIDYLANVEQ